MRLAKNFIVLMCFLKTMRDIFRVVFLGAGYVVYFWKELFSKVSKLECLDFWPMVREISMILLAGVIGRCHKNSFCFASLQCQNLSLWLTFLYFLVRWCHSFLIGFGRAWGVPCVILQILPRSSFLFFLDNFIPSRIFKF